MNKRILLAEDNAISREFLHEALMPLAAPVDIADSLAVASALALQHQYALFLCDVHLPDGGPGEIFRSLTQLQSGTTIVAITAGASTATSQFLTDIGYQEVWSKPITMAVLQNNVARLLGINFVAASLENATDIWDEVTALRAVGNNQVTLKALRNMFLADLSQHIKSIEQAHRDADATGLKTECHKLLAGCGFVGAASLAQAIKRLSEEPQNTAKINDVLLQAGKYLAGD